MNNRKIDISLIKKYMAGKLDNHAMHQLERRAQDDPFLMDAIEGYERVQTDQQHNITELAHRLNQRIAFKEKRLIPRRYIAAAASIVLVLGIGAAWLYLHQPAGGPLVAVNEAPAIGSAPYQLKKPAVNNKAGNAVAYSPTVIKPNTILQPRNSSKNSKIARVDTGITALVSLVTQKPLAQKADTIPVNEMVVMGVQERKRKTAESVVTLPDARAKPVAAASEQPLKSRVDGVMITNTDDPGGRSYTPQIVQGRIIDQSGGQPMPGVAIRVKGTAIGTQTDANGNFKLPGGSKDKTLVVGYLGYKTQELPAAQLDSIKTLAMVTDNSSSLNEVTVAGSNTGKSPQGDPADSKAPHPKAGWDSYKKYLTDNAIYGDKKTGAVQLGFTVLPDGTVANIHVIKSLSIAADKKAIELIRNGPAWEAGADGNAGNVKITVNFTGK